MLWTIEAPLSMEESATTYDSSMEGLLIGSFEALLVTMADA